MTRLRVTLPPVVSAPRRPAAAPAAGRPVAGDRRAVVTPMEDEQG